MKKTIATPPGQPDNEVKLTKAEEKALRAEWATAEAKKEANAYKGKRAQEYPSIEDQLDMIYHEGLPKWKAFIKKIKDKYPKPE